MPVTVYAETRCVKAHADALAALGSRALLVTGRAAAARCGALRDVTDALTAHGRSWVLYDEVEENPSIETVMRARAFGLQEGADFVVGIGGGSPMDAAKAIAIMMSHREADASFLYAPPAPMQGLPLATVPTTCGTGSEVTPNAVLTIHARKTKGSSNQRLWPRLALVDADYLRTAPLPLLRATAFDAFAHLIESGLNTNATDYSRVFVHEGLRLWGRSRAALLCDGMPPAAARWDLMNAATLAGMAIAHTGTSLPHALSYGVTYRLHVPHGRAASYFLPGYLREAEKTARDFLLGLAGFSDVEAFAQFYLRACGPEQIPEALLRELTEELLGYEAKLRACPFPADRACILRICGL